MPSGGQAAQPVQPSDPELYEQDGTYVQPHYQTNPNSPQYDNFNTRGNYNPYTGRTGTSTP